MNEDKYRLTTEDNPFNPFTQWSEWLFFDISKGYNTCERIASRTSVTTQLPPDVAEKDIEDSIDELIELGAINKQGEFVNYKKVLNPKYKQETL